VVVVVPDAACPVATLERLAGGAAAAAVRRAFFRRRWLADPAVARQVDRAAVAVAAAVPVLCLRRPAGAVGPALAVARRFMDDPSGNALARAL
jgi:hypothetical protein